MNKENIYKFYPYLEKLNKNELMCLMLDFLKMVFTKQKDDSIFEAIESLLNIHND